jgi:hypothetical protein
MRSGWVAGVVIASSWWLSRPPASAAVRRRDLRQLLRPGPASAPGIGALATRSASVRLVVLPVATFAVGAVADAAAGLLVAFACASATAFVALRLANSGGPRRWRAQGFGPDRLRAPNARAVPASLDLLAACLSAGAAPAQALQAVGSAFDGDVGQRLTGVARLLLLGAPVETAWSACLDDARWAPVARAIIRAHYSGAALTDVLVHLADDRRRALRAEAAAAAQRAGIRSVLPLGACFLPAFVLVGVVPVVAGFAQALWA